MSERMTAESDKIQEAENWLLLSSHDVGQERAHSSECGNGITNPNCELCRLSVMLAAYADAQSAGPRELEALRNYKKAVDIAFTAGMIGMSGDIGFKIPCHQFVTSMQVAFRHAATAYMKATIRKPTEDCPHERLDEEGYCRKCGADMRSGVDLSAAGSAAQATAKKAVVEELLVLFRHFDPLYPPSEEIMKVICKCSAVLAIPDAKVAETWRWWSGFDGLTAEQKVKVFRFMDELKSAAPACDRCKGTGYEPNHPPSPCANCDGTGHSSAAPATADYWQTGLGTCGPICGQPGHQDNDKPHVRNPSCWNWKSGAAQTTPEKEPSCTNVTIAELSTTPSSSSPVETTGTTSVKIADVGELCPHCGVPENIRDAYEKAERSGKYADYAEYLRICSTEYEKMLTNGARVAVEAEQGKEKK